ncbi:monocarboxylate transporter [Alternaria alternata]|nr:monocarboxylate transporter [Alternaria alternata]
MRRGRFTARPGASNSGLARNTSLLTKPPRGCARIQCKFQEAARRHRGVHSHREHSSFDCPFSAFGCTLIFHHIAFVKQDSAATMSVTETVTVPPSTTRETQNGSDSTIILNSLDSRIQAGSRDAPSPQSEDNAQANDVWDSREGWPVVGAGAAIFFVYLGLVYSYGIVQLQLERRQLASVPTLSFIGSVAAAISPLTGAFVARIIKRIGYRATAATGSFLLGLGEFCAGFSTHSVPAMFVTQGFLFGIGAALLFLPAASLPSLWFKRKRGLATGLVYGGAGVGSAVIALSLEKLIDTTSLETALKVLGACAWLICLPATYFLKPPKGSRRAVSKMQWYVMLV